MKTVKFNPTLHNKTYFEQLVNPSVELFKWGPIDCLPLYIDFWCLAMPGAAKLFARWPSFLVHITNEAVFFVSEYPRLRKQGEKNFTQFILNDQQFRKCWQHWEKALQAHLQVCTEIEAINLQKVTTPELNHFCTKIRDSYTDFWIIGLLPELANWGGEELLKRALEKQVPSEAFLQIFERLSAPEDYSFYQEEEMDLLHAKLSSTPAQSLQVHQQKYFWLLNSYHHTKVLGVDYFKKQLQKLTKVTVQQKIQAIQKLPENTLKEKEKIIKKYHLSPEVAKISHRLAYTIWWQDHRKKYIFMTNHYLDVLLQEIARRFAIDFYVLHYYKVSEIIDLLQQNSKVPLSELHQRQLDLCLIYNALPDEFLLISGSSAKELSAPYYTVQVDPHQKEFKGMVVSQGQGKVTGTVKVCISSKELGKVKSGDILVSSFTAPDYVIAMRKAAGIVTDEGGITSHAAIVSRELGKPCIVATRIATKVLHDGDTVELDVTTGVIRKL